LARLSRVLPIWADVESKPVKARTVQIWLFCVPAGRIKVGDFTCACARHAKTAHSPV
jgi:hypothetical protein